MFTDMDFVGTREYYQVRAVRLEQQLEVAQGEIENLRTHLNQKNDEVQRLAHDLKLAEATLTSQRDVLKTALIRCPKCKGDFRPKFSKPHGDFIEGCCSCATDDFGVVSPHPGWVPWSENR